jgi:hypothetical protein
VAPNLPQPAINSAAVNYARRYPRIWFCYFWASCALLMLRYVEGGFDVASNKATLLDFVMLAVATLAVRGLGVWAADALAPG